MHYFKILLAATATLLTATITQAADLSYNGLAITPQMGWVSFERFALDEPATDRLLSRTTGMPSLVT